MNLKIVSLLLSILLSTSILPAKECRNTLLQAQQLTEKQDWAGCIELLKEETCTSYAHYNLLLNAYMGKEAYAQVRQRTENMLRQAQGDSIDALAHYYNALALLKQNQYSLAYQHANQAIELWDTPTTAEYALFCNTLGNVLEAQNKHTEAVHAYNKALSIYSKLPNDSLTYKWQISTLANLSNAYMAFNSELAMKQLQQAMRIYQKHPQSTLTAYVTLLNNMGSYFNKQGNFQAAALYYKQATDIQKNQNLANKQGYAVSLLNVITAMYNAEQYTETTPYIQEYLRILRQNLQRNFTILSPQERENYWNAQAQILDNLLVTATYAALSDKNANASLLYDICLLSKSLLLDTSIHLEHVINTSKNSKLKQSRALLIEKQQTFAALSDKNTPYAKQVSMQCDSLEQILLHEMTQLQAQMKQLYITWQDIQQKLTKQDMAVEFVCLGEGKDTEYAVILLRNNWKYPKVYYLNGLAETLEAKQIPLLQMHDNAIFGKLVWQEIMKEAKPDDHIYFVPAGELQLMSAEYFTIYQDVKMHDRYKMHRLSSTKQLLRPKSSQTWQKVALVGGMDYNANMDEIAYYANEYHYTAPRGNQPVATNQIWTPLPGSLHEVQTIHQLLEQHQVQTFLATHDAATEGAIQAISKQKYDILHIATHGFYSQNQEEAGLVMAGANTLQLTPNPTYGTGILTAQNMAKLDLKQTQLAVLSACQTGVGKITIEGVSGLQRAFKRAGVQSLLVSLWEVNDAVTATLMETFYKALMANYSVYDAFMIATDAIRQHTFTINGVQTSGDNLSLYGAFVLID